MRGKATLPQEGSSLRRGGDGAGGGPGSSLPHGSRLHKGGGSRGPLKWRKSREGRCRAWLLRRRRTTTTTTGRRRRCRRRCAQLPEVLPFLPLPRLWGGWCCGGCFCCCFSSALAPPGVVLCPSCKTIVLRVGRGGVSPFTLRGWRGAVVLSICRCVAPARPPQPQPPPPSSPQDGASDRNDNQLERGSAALPVQLSHASSPLSPCSDKSHAPFSPPSAARREAAGKTLIIYREITGPLPPLTRTQAIARILCSPASPPSGLDGDWCKRSPLSASPLPAQGLRSAHHFRGTRPQPCQCSDWTAGSSSSRLRLA
nr:uncharacterized protein LOC110086270 [Pogona vitticeps]